MEQVGGVTTASSYRAVSSSLGTAGIRASVGPIRAGRGERGGVRERSARALSFSETHPDLADSLFVVTVLTEVESRTAQNDKLHQLTTMGKPMTCDTRPDDAHAGSTRGLSTRSTEVS